MIKIPLKITEIFYKLGKIFFDVFSSVGEIIIFFLDCVKYSFLDKFYPKIFFSTLD